MHSPLASTSVHATDIFDFVCGTFNLTGGWSIPYLSTVMTFRQASESLQLVTEFAGWETLLWQLEELFQRDIDWPRVERKIVPYLSNPYQPRFFNSLTVALIPKMDESLVEYADLDSVTWHPPAIPEEEAPGRIITAGPITLRYYFDWKDVGAPESKLGKVRWKKDETFCVAIDGQHRLAAIKELAEVGGDMARADISVLLVLLDPRLGFNSPQKTTNLDILRSLFIDLNKHAKPVSRTRLILLDDRDPTSLCTRALIGSALRNGFEEAYGERPVLPLTLVDWHTDGAKVDRGPYLVSVLTLDWAVQKVLGVSPIPDPMQYGSVKSQIKSLGRRLDIDLDEATKRVEDAERSERPFSYSDTDPDELGDIERSFGDIWAPSLTWIFTRLAPYERVINARVGNGSNVADFTNWYQLYVRAQKDSFEGHATRDYRRLIGRWAGEQLYYETDLLDDLREIDEKKLVPDESYGSLAFTVVFQKALILAWLDFLKLDEMAVAQAATDMGLVGTDPEPESGQDAIAVSNLRATKVFVEALNRVILRKNTMFSPHYERHGVVLWLGTLLSADRSTIDFTEAAAIRGQDILLVPVYLEILRSKVSFEDADAVLEFVDGSSGRSDPAARLSGVFRSFIGGLRTNAGDSAAVRILRARGVDDPEDEAERRELLRERVRLFLPSREHGTK